MQEKEKVEKEEKQMCHVIYKAGERGKGHVLLYVVCAMVLGQTADQSSSRAQAAEKHSKQKRELFLSRIEQPDIKWQE